jgi:amino acid transporter
MEQALSAPPEAVLAPPHAGLRAGALSPMETLAQSISTIAPTASPTMTVPLVFVLAGNGTWLAYLFAMAAIFLIALCISRFARYTSCSGSLYTYATSSLPPVTAAIAGWAMLLAYVATAASVTGGFIIYANEFVSKAVGHPANTVLLGLICVAGATFIAYRDVQVSARMMLWIEAAAVTMIGFILALLLWRNGLHIDQPQLHLTGISASGVRLGIVLALFSFVGFESATSLGAEAVNPLRTIPRAVIQSALFAGIFFVLCAYLETLGMHKLHQDLGQSTAPMSALAGLAGVGRLGIFIDFGALVSMFSCVLACLTAAARVLLRMARNGLVPGWLGATHPRNSTPHLSVFLMGLCTALLVAGLAARGVTGSDIYGWMGSLAVYGFITCYGLAAVALPIYLKHKHHLTAGTIVLSAAACLAMLLALAGTVYPVPESPLNWLPYMYLAYLALGTGWFFINRRTRAALA